MRGLGVLLVLFCNGILAAPWDFGTPVNVTLGSAPGVFTHLESAGRKNIAVSDGWVAVIWEDNRDGNSRCYVALKQLANNVFSEPLKVSGSNESAEPAIVAIGVGRFALAWEEDGNIWARLLTVESAMTVSKLSDPVQLNTASAMQVSLGHSKENGLYAAWSEQGISYKQIMLGKLALLPNDNIKLLAKIVVDKHVKGNQFYPSIAEISGNKTIVAWEDRHAGYTRLLYAESQNLKTASAPRELNEYKERDKKFGSGLGTGVMRVALATQGRDGLVAIWEDKRDFTSGYDIYAALANGPTVNFGANEKVQDEFGNTFAQWHPSIAANHDGHIVAVWDDDREGSPDVWLSWREAGRWSGDLAVPGASGAGVQSDPSITMDDSGNLHLAWVEKMDLNGQSAIRYLFARLKQTK